MVIRPFRLSNLLFAVVLASAFVSCSKTDQSGPSSKTDFLQFSLFPGEDITQVDNTGHQINIRVPDTITSGSQLIANFTLSTGAAATMGGINQQSGTTYNDFEKDLKYTVTAADQHTQAVWTVRATNNDYSLSWGLGHFINRSLSSDRSYTWYIDQETTGAYALTNCGPASVTMAIKWADSSFSKTAQDARQTFRSDGGWWFTSDMDAYLNMFGIVHGIIPLSAIADTTGALIARQLDHNQIVILCLDMNNVRAASDPAARIDKFYPTSPGWGHFIVLKGYRKVDQELFFEAFDPYSFGNRNTDQSLKGMNRYYRYEDLAAACLPWWNYGFVIAKKGQNLSLDALKMKMNPANVPVAHNF
jgi:hypothetical protein